MSRVIHVFVKGVDDERFIKRAATELTKNHRVKVYKYAQTTKTSLEKHIELLNKSGAAYMFLSDMDRAACYTKKKAQIRSKKSKSVNLARTVIVKAEIESWYLAGLDWHDANSLGIRHVTNTEGVTKEIFEEMSKHYASRVDCKAAILEKFSLEAAKKQNESFMYFCNKFL